VCICFTPLVKFEDAQSYPWGRKRHRHRLRLTQGRNLSPTFEVLSLVSTNTIALTHTHTRALSHSVALSLFLFYALLRPLFPSPAFSCSSFVTNSNWTKLKKDSRSCSLSSNLMPRTNNATTTLRRLCTDSWHSQTRQQQLLLRQLRRLLQQTLQKRIRHWLLQKYVGNTCNRGSCVWNKKMN